MVVPRLACDLILKDRNRRVNASSIFHQEAMQEGAQEGAVCPTCAHEPCLPFEKNLSSTKLSLQHGF